MSQSKPKQVTDTEGADPRWKDLYKIGGIAAIALALIMLLGVIAFFIWPYSPGFTSAVDIFTAIQTDRIGVLMSLDFFLFLSTFGSILLYLALYVSLKQVNESYALIALVLGLIAAVVIIPARPIIELFYLSDLYAAATTDAARNQYLAAGEALLALFNGTAWAVWNALANVSGLINCFLMLRSNIFSKATAYLGIIISILALGLFVPGIGMYLGLLSMPGTVIWIIVIALRFFQLGQGESDASQAGS